MVRWFTFSTRNQEDQGSNIHTTPGCLGLSDVGKIEEFDNTHHPELLKGKSGINGVKKRIKGQLSTLFDIQFLCVTPSNKHFVM